MNVREKILTNYLDEHDRVTLVRNPKSKWTSGNHTVLDGIFYTYLALTDQLHWSDARRFKGVMHALWVEKDGKLLEGLLERDDKRDEFEGHDNYRAAACASFFVERYDDEGVTTAAQKIEKYGRQNNWIFNNIRPGKITQNKFMDAWFGRFPGFVGHLRLCAGKSPGPIQALCLASGIYAGAMAPRNESTTKILTWFEVEVARHRKQANCDDAIKAWDKQLVKQFGTLGGMFAAHVGEDHPFAEIK